MLFNTKDVLMTEENNLEAVIFSSSYGPVYTWTVSWKYYRFSDVDCKNVTRSRSNAVIAFAVYIQNPEYTNVWTYDKVGLLPHVTKSYQFKKIQ